MNRWFSTAPGAVATDAVAPVGRHFTQQEPRGVRDRLHKGAQPGVTVAARSFAVGVGTSKRAGDGRGGLLAHPDGPPCADAAVGPGRADQPGSRQVRSAQVGA